MFVSLEEDIAMQDKLGQQKLGEVRIASDRAKSPMYWPVRGARNDDWRRDLPEPSVTQKMVCGAVAGLAAVNPVLAAVRLGTGAQGSVVTKPLHMTASENWEYMRAMKTGRVRSSNGG